MTDDSWKVPAELAVRRFAARCLSHQRLEEDPVCVIATERERVLAEIAHAESVPEPVPVIQIKEAQPNGGKRKRAVTGKAG